MADMTWGSAYTYYSGTQAVYQNSCCIDTDKFVFTYQDADDGKIYAIVGTVLGNVISYGSATEVSTSIVGSGYNDVCKLDTDKVVVCYFDSSRYGQARVGTISGTTISFGAVSEFSGELNYHSVRCCALNATKFFVAYKARPGGVYKGHGRIGTVSGTTISMGSVGVFYNGTSAPGACHELSSTKAVLCYMVSNAYGVVVDCSGTTPSYGVALDISDGTVGSYESFALDTLSSTKLVFTWNHNSLVADREGRVVILEVSNSTLSKGTCITFYDYASGVPDVSVVVFNSTTFVMVYCELSPSIDGTCRYCTVSGTTITLGSKEHWDDPYNYSNMEACLVAPYKMVMTTRRTNGATVEVGIVGLGQGDVYPSEAISRVSSIIHRYDRGIYNMVIGFGDVLSDFGIPYITTATRKSYEPTPEDPFEGAEIKGEVSCTEGTSKYVDGVWYLCVGGVWQRQMGL